MPASPFPLLQLGLFPLSALPVVNFVRLLSSWPTCLVLNHVLLFTILIVKLSSAVRLAFEMHFYFLVFLLVSTRSRLIPDAPIVSSHIQIQLEQFFVGIILQNAFLFCSFRSRSRCCFIFAACYYILRQQHKYGRKLQNYGVFLCCYGLFQGNLTPNFIAVRLFSPVLIPKLLLAQ